MGLIRLMETISRELIDPAMRRSVRVIEAWNFGSVRDGVVYALARHGESVDEGSLEGLVDEGTLGVRQVYAALAMGLDRAVISGHVRLFLEQHLLNTADARQLSECVFGRPVDYSIVPVDAAVVEQSGTFFERHFDYLPVDGLAVGSHRHSGGKMCVCRLALPAT